MYLREEVSDQKALRKSAKIAMIAVSVLAAAVCVFLLLTVKPLTEGKYRIVSAIFAVLAGCFDIYIASFVLPYARPKSQKRSAGGKVLHVLGNMVRQIHMYLIWGVIAVMFVNFLFGLVTDTSRAKKVSVFVNVDAVDEAGLETVLNDDLPEGIKMTKVHTFGYFAFGNDDIGLDDIYIVKESDAEKYIEAFSPLYDFWNFRDIDKYYVKDDIPYGILIRSSDERFEAAAEYIGYEYVDGRAQDEYYLFFGRDCLHKGKDGAAAKVAEKLISIK